MKKLIFLMALLLNSNSWAQINIDQVQFADEAYKEAREKLDHHISYTVLIGYSDEVVEKFKKDHLNSFFRRSERELLAVDSVKDLPRMYRLGEKCSAYSFNIANDKYICFENKFTDSVSDHLHVILDLIAVDKQKSSDVTSSESRRLRDRLKYLGDVSIMRDERLVKDDGVYAVVNTQLAKMEDLKVVRRFFQDKKSGVFVFSDESEIAKSSFPLEKNCSIYFINKQSNKVGCVDDIKKTKTLDNVTTLNLLFKLKG